MLKQSAKAFLLIILGVIVSYCKLCTLLRLERRIVKDKLTKQVSSAIINYNFKRI